MLLSNFVIIKQLFIKKTNCSNLLRSENLLLLLFDHFHNLKVISKLIPNENKLQPDTITEQFHQQKGNFTYVTHTHTNGLKNYTNKI